MISPAGNSGGEPPRGFTLVELLAVVAIMGLIAGAAVVALRGLRAPSLAGAASEVASAMKMTRQMAISSGRKMLLVFPHDLSAANLGAAPLRSYAIFECLDQGFETREPPYYYHPETAPNPRFLARTEWRKLPDGIFFCNFASFGYSSMAGDPFSGILQNNVPYPTNRVLLAAGSGSVRSGEEWRYFMSFTNLPIGTPSNPGSVLATINAPFVGFLPDGRAFYLGSSSYSQAALRLVQGYVPNENPMALAVTDTNSFFYIETDARSGRIRVRGRDSYRE